MNPSPTTRKSWRPIAGVSLPEPQRRREWVKLGILVAGILAAGLLGGCATSPVMSPDGTGREIGNPPPSSPGSSVVWRVAGILYTSP